jgi:hypothetical protein
VSSEIVIKDPDKAAVTTTSPLTLITVFCPPGLYSRVPDSIVSIKVVIVVVVRLMNGCVPEH